MAGTSRLDDPLTKLENAVAHDVAMRINQHSSGRSPKSSHAEAKEQIKLLFLELIGEDEEAQYDYNEARWGDGLADHASVVLGINEEKESLRQLVEAL